MRTLLRIAIVNCDLCGDIVLNGYKTEVEGREYELVMEKGLHERVEEKASI